MDHLRAVLVFLVVFGHFLEASPGGCVPLYRAIYAFHIPALLFLSGRFARFSRRRVRGLLLLYAVCQLLYRLLDWLVLGAPQEAASWLLVPYWHLWYLVVLAGCLALTPLLEKIPRRLRPLAVFASLLIAVLWGVIPVSGYWLSFGRLLSFFPFFLTGLYCKNLRLPAGKCRILLLLLSALLTAAGTWLLLRWDALPTGLLFGAQSFARLGASAEQKVFSLALAFCWIFFLLLLPWPSRPIPLWTGIGQATLPIYLLHGFFVLAAKNWALFAGLGLLTPLPALAASLLLTALLGRPELGRRMNVCFFPRSKGKNALFSSSPEKKD